MKISISKKVIIFGLLTLFYGIFTVYIFPNYLLEKYFPGKCFGLFPDKKCIGWFLSFTNYLIFIWLCVTFLISIIFSVSTKNKVNSSIINAIYLALLLFIIFIIIYLYFRFLH